MTPRRRLGVAVELTGRWTIERRVRDLWAGTAGRFHGIATITPDGRWVEEGVLEFGPYRGPARRELRIVGDEVQFADGRRFHPLDLSGAPVEHRCGDDRYVGRFRRLGPDALDVVWEVTGPRKQQHIDTSYRRA